jgi:hypothetical protein
MGCMELNIRIHQSYPNKRIWSNIKISWFENHSWIVYLHILFNFFNIIFVL